MGMFFHRTMTRAKEKNKGYARLKILYVYRLHTSTSWYEYCVVVANALGVVLILLLGHRQKKNMNGRHIRDINNLSKRHTHIIQES